MKKEAFDRYKIFLSSDNNYFIHLFVTIYSIIENCSDNSKIAFFIFDGGISEKNKERLMKFIKKNKAELKFIKPNRKKYSNAKLWGHVSEATYYRLEIPLLEKRKKVLYLDCDLVVEGDILEIFSENLNKKAIGAVYDYQIKYLQKKRDFNAGVLLIDCGRWNLLDYSKKVEDYLAIKGTNLTLGDQELLNDVFSKDWNKLPLNWNRQRTIYDLRGKEMNLSKEEYEELIEKPKIIHYVGKIKPWDYKYVFPDKKNYVVIRKKIDNGFLYKNKNIMGFLFKLARFFIYRLKIIKLIRMEK